jgi:hypothetical protein
MLWCLLCTRDNFTLTFIFSKYAFCHIDWFHMILRIKSDHFLKQRLSTELFNGDTLCFLWCNNLIFKYCLDEDEIWGSHGGQDVDVGLWVVTRRDLVGRYQHFGGTYCLHLQPWSMFVLNTGTDCSRAEKLWLVCGVMGDVILCYRERDIYRSQKFYATIHSEKNDLPYNSFILQTPISSSCMFSQWTIKHPLLLPTSPRSVGISSPTYPV